MARNVTLSPRWDRWRRTRRKEMLLAGMTPGADVIGMLDINP